MRGVCTTAGCQLSPPHPVFPIMHDFMINVIAFINRVNKVLTASRFQRFYFMKLRLYEIRVS
jgi:hypothetical protein